MKNNSLYRQYLGYYVITLLLMISMAFIMLNSMKSMFYEKSKLELEETALLLRNLLPLDDFPNTEKIDSFCKTAGNNLETRITIILPKGKVIGDSKSDISVLNNHAERPEIIQAFNSKKGFSIRYSSSLGLNLLYLAIPITVNGNIVGVLRTSFPEDILINRINELFANIALVTFVFIIGLTLVTVYIVRKINKPIIELTNIAMEYSKENFFHRLHIEKPKELKILSDTMAEMAVQIQGRIKSLTHQRNEFEAILTGMIEAVIVLDENLNIVESNPAALKLVDKDFKKVKDRPIIDVFRNSGLFELAGEILENGNPVEREITLISKNPEEIIQTPKKVILQVHGNVIKNLDNKKSRRLVLVLNNITKVKEVEKLRKDFVANVSHELKTPITSIKGFIETLLDGASEDSKTNLHFLNIIFKQSERLNSIIEDLLKLSRLEKSENEELETENVQLLPLLKSAIQVCSEKANKKVIKVEVLCNEGFKVRVNSLLLEQAIVNLVDNAVKYSENNTNVRINAYNENNTLTISVSDEGRGIPQKDLSHIFERFYRVDKARSRDLGGTGLGLSIVKHIVISHNGSIDIDSKLGDGSIFTIKIPLLK